MAKPKRSKGRSKPPARLDTYEAEGEMPHEEKYAGQRYDVSRNSSEFYKESAKCAIRMTKSSSSDTISSTSGTKNFIACLSL